MPKIKSSQLRGMPLADLKQLLQDVVDDGTYRDKDVEKIRTKIEKRLTQGDTLTDEEMVREIINDMNLGDES